jgi:hypothetical protein
MPVPSFLLLGSLVFTALQPAHADLAGRAAAGRLPSFAVILDARYRTPRNAFDAFAQWSRSRPGDAGRCSEADTRGLARAMAIVAERAPDRPAAQRIWREVSRVVALARRRASAVPAAAGRPTGKPSVARELARRAAVDQAWRGAIYGSPHDPLAGEAIRWAASSALCHIDNEDADYLKALIARAGWPRISVYGRTAAENAWLIVQHADDQPDFQERALALMAALLGEHEVDPPNYALLFDRVALARRRPQRYATQFGEGVGGCLAARPVEDHLHVDERRASVGLPRLADYASILERMYHARACTDLFATSERLE